MRYAILLVAAIGCNAQTISSLSAEIQRNPTASLYVERAAAYLAAGDVRGALADTDRALDKDALNIRALTLRAQANSKLGRYSAAISDLSGAIAIAPGNAALYVQRSEAYVAAGDQPRAVADRNEALRLDPRVVAELDRRPATLIPPPAAPEPPVVASTPPPVPGKAPASPAVTPQKISVPADAPKAIAAATSSDSPEDYYQRAKELLDDRKALEAVAELDEAIKLQPSNPILFNTRGYAYFLAKDMKRAIQDYDEAIRLNPEYLNATQNRSVARRAAGDSAGANEDRQRATELAKKQGIKIQ